MGQRDFGLVTFVGRPVQGQGRGVGDRRVEACSVRGRDWKTRNQRNRPLPYWTFVPIVLLIFETQTKSNQDRPLFE